MTSARASVAVIVLLAVALLGGGGYAAIKGGWFDGATKRAKTSTETTAALVGAQTASGGAAAAYVATMGAVIADLPESKERAFLGKAGVIALSYLPAPDPAKLLEAEKLKVAFLTGQLELANSLTANALQDSGRAKQELTRAISAKRASDAALEESAAEARGANSEKFLFMAVALLAAGLWIYTKMTSVGAGSMARIVADIRSGTTESNPALAAIDTHTNSATQWATRGNVWFNAKLARIFS